MARSRSSPTPAGVRNEVPGLLSPGNDETLPQTFSAFGTYSTDGVVITVTLTGEPTSPKTTTVAAGSWAVTFTNAVAGSGKTLRATATGGPATASNLTITVDPPVDPMGGDPES